MNITPQDITLYTNLGLVGILVIALISFFIGFAKGIYKKIWSIIFYGTLLTLLTVFIKQIADFAYNFDFSTVAGWFGAKVTIDGQEFKTGGEIVHYFVNTMAAQQGMDISSYPVMEMVDSIAHSVLQLGIYIVGQLVIYILGIFILCPLLYHVLIKWFIPREARKNHKVKGLGGLLGFVEAIVCMSLFFAPFTALANTIVSKLRNENNQITVDPTIDNSTYQLIMNILQGYNNSVLANALISLQINGKSLDVALMDYVTNTNLLGEEGANLDFFTEVGNFASLAVDALATGAIDITTGQIAISTLLESEVVTKALDLLAKSSLVTTILPIAVNFAITLAPTEGMPFDVSKLDLSNVDWSSTLSSLSGVVEAVQKTHYISQAFENENFVNEFAFNRDQETYVKQALRGLGNVSLINELMPQVIASLLSSFKEGENTTTSYRSPLMRIDGEGEGEGEGEGQTQEIINIKEILGSLPEEAYSAESYKDILWGDELVKMYESVLNVNDQYAASEGVDITIGTLQNVMESNYMNILFGTNQEYSSAEDYDNNPFVNGGQIGSIKIPGIKKILGLTTSEDSSGIFDLKIIDKLLLRFDGMSKIVDNLNLDILSDSEDALSSLAEEMKDWTLTDLKNEFNSLIDIATPILKVVGVVQSSMQEHGGEFSKDVALDLFVDNVKLALNYFCDKANDSYLLGQFVPAVAESFVHKNDTYLALDLHTTDINFTKFSEDTNFYKELKGFVNTTFTNLQSLAEVIFEEEISLDTIFDKIDNVESILEAIYSNQIMNRQLTQDEIDQGKITNFEKAMVNLFKQYTEQEIEDGQNVSMNIPHMTNNLISIDEAKILSIKNTSGGWSGENGEISHLFNVVKSLKAQNEGETQILLDFIKDSSGDISSVILDAGNEIKRIFATIDNSILMKSALPETLNSVLGDGLSSMGVDINFNSISDWRYEGEELGETINNLKVIKGEGSLTDIGQLLLNADSSLLSESEFKAQEASFRNEYKDSYDYYFMNKSKGFRMLYHLANTQSFGKSGTLADFVYTTLKDTLTSGSDPLIDPAIYNTNAIKGDFHLGLVDEVDGEGQPVSYTSAIYDSSTNTKVQWTNEDAIIFNYAENYEDQSFDMVDEDYSAYKGEVFNLAKLLVYTDYFDGTNDLTSAGSDTLNEVLSIVMKTYPLRGLISPILEDKVGAFATTPGQVADLINACDFTVFDSSLMNMYATNNVLADRYEEEQARLKEIPAIISIYEEKDNVQGLDTDAIKDFVTVSNVTHESRLTKLLRSMHDSNIFNSELKIQEVDSVTNERTTLTAFEKLFNMIFDAASIFRQLTNEEIFSYNNKQVSDKWITDEVNKEGEIYDLNKALYDTTETTIYDQIINNPSFDLDSIKALYNGEDKNILKGLLTSMSQSNLLRTSQLWYVMDNNVYSNIKSSLTSNTLITPDVNYVLVDNPYELSTNVNWANEGQALDGLMQVFISLDLDNMDIKSVSTESIEDMFDSIKDSGVLSYDSNTSSFTSNVLERSMYEYLVSSFDSFIIDAIYDKNLYSLSSAELANAKTYTSTLDTTNYEKEETQIVSLIDAYKGFDSFLSGDSINLNVQSLDETGINTINQAIKTFLDALKGSDVFNYRVSLSDAYKDTTNESDRDIYEYSVNFFSDKIKDALVSIFGLTTGAGYKIDYSPISLHGSSHLKYEAQQNTIYNFLDTYKANATTFGALGSASSLTDINAAAIAIEELISCLKDSNTYDNRPSGELSIYQGIIISLDMRIKDKLVDNVLAGSDSTNTTVYNIKTKGTGFTNFTDYDGELDNIMDIIDKASAIGLDTGISIDVSYLQTEGNDTKIIDLLNTIYNSYVLNYRKGVSGRTLSDDNSMFEHLVYKVVGQSTITSQIYDSQNTYQAAMLAGATGGDNVIKAKIRYVNSNDINGVQFFTSGTTAGEINKIIGIVKDHMAGGNLDISSLETAKGALKAISDIYMLHDIVPFKIREVSETTQIGSASSDTLSQYYVLHTPSYYALEQAYNVKPNSYDTELDAIVDFIGFAEDVASMNTDVKQLNEEDVGSPFYNMLSILVDSQIFKPISSDLVASITYKMAYKQGAYDVSLGKFFITSNVLTSVSDQQICTMVQNNLDAYPSNYADIGTSIDNYIKGVVKCNYPYSQVTDNDPSAIYAGGIAYNNFAAFINSLPYFGS